MDTIKRVIERSYLEGIHERQDEAAVRDGFHKEFRMYVRDGNCVRPVTVDQWFDRVQELKRCDPELWEKPTTARFDQIDVSGECAVVKLTVQKGSEYFSTDYMMLYRLDDGWRIVAKVFTTSGLPSSAETSSA
jgi:hypothetical protein